MEVGRRSDRAGAVYSLIAMLRGHVRTTLRTVAAGYRIGADELLVVLALEQLGASGPAGLARATGQSRSDLIASLRALADEDLARSRSEAAAGAEGARWSLTALGASLAAELRGADVWREVMEDMAPLAGSDLDRLLDSLEALAGALGPADEGPDDRSTGTAWSGREADVGLGRAHRLSALVEALYRSIRGEHSAHLSAQSGGMIDSAAYMVLDLARRPWMSATLARDALGVNDARLDEISARLVRWGYLRKRRREADVRDVILETTAAGHAAIEELRPFAPDSRFLRALTGMDEAAALEARLGAAVAAVGRGELVAAALGDQISTAVKAVDAEPPSTLAPTELRAAMGLFATGVALVTVSTATGARAVTVNSLTSVSLEPVLVLVCLVRERPAVLAIQETGEFGVNILSAGQEELAGRFGRAEGPANSHSLAGIDWRLEDGIPRIEGAIAWLGCRVDRLIDAGDHLIVLGIPVTAEVTAADGPGRPMLFWSGRYAALADGHRTETR